MLIILKDDVEVCIVVFLSEEVIYNLKSADWKVRFAGMLFVVEIVIILKDMFGDVCDVFVIGFVLFFGWSDSNF